MIIVHDAVLLIKQRMEIISLKKKNSCNVMKLLQDNQ